MNECELIAIKECSISVLFNIPLIKEVVYLKISRKEPPLIFILLHKKVNQWLLMHLTLRGRVLITEAEETAQWIYAVLALNLLHLQGIIERE